MYTDCFLYCQAVSHLEHDIAELVETKYCRRICGVKGAILENLIYKLAILNNTLNHKLRAIVPKKLRYNFVLSVSVSNKNGSAKTEKTLSII